jgi:hypothetical protein
VNALQWTDDSGGSGSPVEEVEALAVVRARVAGQPAGMLECVRTL